MEYVVLVDQKDQELGIAEKMYAHEHELLHRAISVILFNRQGQMLIQQRAEVKYHCPKEWANACCTHPRKGESYYEAAIRRLQEELGIQTSLKEIYSFIYKAKVEPNLVEHELDHVFMGEFEGEIPFNPEEVMDVAWVSIDLLRKEIHREDKYTPWFRKIFAELDARGLL